MKNLKYFVPAFLLAAITISGCKSNSTNPPANGGSGPVINSFTAAPATVDFSTTTDSSVLTWDLDGTQTSVTIDQGVGDQTANSGESVAVYPSVTTTYTLTAKNSAGTSTQKVTVTVINNTADANSPPTPSGLHAAGVSTSPSTINLSWTEPSGSVAASHYIIERWSALQPLDTIDASAPGPNSYSDAQLYPTVVYYYRIKAVSSGNAASAWSNVAFATAPGQMPTINKISIIPTTVPTLTPGQTQQFTAIAYDASNNQIPLSPSAFIWSSDNAQSVVINGTGVATALSKQGSANITASLPNDAYGDLTASNAVNVAVASQSSTTLVLFYGSAPTDFTNYLAPLAASGVTFDQISDLSSGGAPQFTFDQIKGYAKIVVIQWDVTFNSDAASILAEYVEQANKKLVIVAGAYGGIDGSALAAANLANVTQGYQVITDLNPAVQAQSGTAFAGLNFTLFNSSLNDAIQTTILNGNGQAALIATRSDDNSQQIGAFQESFSTGSSMLYSGITVDQVDADHQNQYVKDFMTF